VITLRVNGRRHQVNAPAQQTLLSVLRNDLGLTGTKYGCGEGVCGACTVLVDGAATPSCMTPASRVAGREITTIEGLAKGPKLHPVQEAFLEKSAFQCGFCTPGMIMGAAALLREKPKPSAAEVKQALENHVCRCGTYPRIVEAVRWAASRGGSRRDA
jgi:aerobic-type carbon monoxide dehydrogenase small subunit (CoxS/CutS family)